MKVETADGDIVDLGVTEASPTISITDYSRRVTDDFGVTTVVKRGFSRRLSLRFQLPTANVDALQARLASLRATKATWIADDSLAWLAVDGFFKDLEFDLALPPTSFGRLTIEGVAETEVVADPGGDPAPAGHVSTLMVLQPAEGDVLIASDVPENDYPAWAVGTTYAAGARVIKAATHRIYESIAAGNLGNDPAAAYDKWIDIGPTKRWAMFDQSLGTATTAAGSIVVQVVPARAVALLDVIAATVRLKGTGYDKTKSAAGGTVTFLDVPATAGNLTVTVTGPDIVEVGSLVQGALALLGVTESSPTAGITDYSRKEVDDFGDVTIVERAWSKRMAAKALIATSAIDKVANRIAGVRGRPALWIGQDGQNALTVYGFFKDFGIEVGTGVSKLALNIEGLSKAPPIPEAAPDSSLDLLGEWLIGATYSQTSIVKHGGRRFWSKADNNVGHEPPAVGTGDAWWALIDPIASVTDIADAGALASEDAVQFGDGSIHTGTGTTATDAGYQTAQGTAAGIAGQGALATQNSANFGTQVTNVPANVSGASAALNLYFPTPNPTMTISGNSVSQTASVWNWNALSKEFAIGSCLVRFQMRANSTGGRSQGVIGIPSAQPGAINGSLFGYAIYPQSTGALWVVDNGVEIDTGYTWAIDDNFALLYDGSRVIYFRNGAEFRTSTAGVAPARLCYLGVFLYNGSITGLQFDQLSTPTASVTGPNAHTVKYDYTVTPVSGQLSKDFAYTLYVNGVPITAGVTWTYTVKTGTVNGFTAADGAKAVAGAGQGTFTLNSVGTDTASVRLTATIGGVSAQADLSITRSVAAQPAGSSNLATGVLSGTTSTSSYADKTGTLNATVPTGKTGTSTTANCNVSIPSAGANGFATCTFKLMRLISGAWTQVGASVVATATERLDAETGGWVNESGNVTLDIPDSGLTAGVTYPYRIEVARTGGARVATLGGDVLVTAQ